MTQDPQAAGRPAGNFLSEGFRELGRKLDRSKLRGAMRKLEADRAAALAALGQRAWEAKVDLSPYAALRDRLSGLESRAGELSETASRLDKEKAAFEAEKKSELEKFAARRKAVEDAKKPVDAALAAARSARSATEQAIRQGDSRLAAIAGRLPALERDIAALGAPEQAQKLAAAQAERAKLGAEQGSLAGTVEKARAALPGQVAEESRLGAESQKHAAEIAAIEAERKAAIGRLDGELARVRKEQQGTTQQAGAVHKDRGAGYGELGAALYAANVAAPELAEAMGRVVSIDRERERTEATLGASLAETGSLAGGTMAKFWSVVLGVPLLLAAIGYGGWQFLQKRAAPAPVAARPAPAAPAGTVCEHKAPPTHGEGVAVMTDCSRYEGTFVESRLHGKGRKVGPGPELIEGTFFGGYLTGPGVRVYRDGRRFEAEFSGGRPIGPGKLTMPDGTIYEGRFWGPTVVGWAVRRSPNGEVVAGDWREGPGGAIQPFGTMLRVKADKSREKVHASEIDPTVPKPAAPPAGAPQPTDAKPY